MAIVHGQSGAEIQTLNRCPDGIREFSDINSKLETYKVLLSEDKKRYLETLPLTIQNEKRNLANLKIMNPMGSLLES